MEKIILHADCNSFFASVECLLNPKLKNVPMAVCGDIECRHGIILAKNEIAKKYNVQTAEPIWKAKQKCKNLVLVKSHYSEYLKYSKMVNDIYKEYTDKIEPFGIDESWLDVTEVTNLFGDGIKIANTLRERVKNEIGITISVGVSYNKILAKLGSDYKKPDATTVITKDNFKTVIYPLKVNDMMYVGKATGKILNNLGIKTIGDLSECNKEFLMSKLGKSGLMLYNFSHGIADDKVRSIYDKTDIKSISNDITFARDLIGIEDVKFGVRLISESVATRLKEKEFKAYTIQVAIKDVNLGKISKQKTLSNPTNLIKDIYNVSLAIIKESWSMAVPIRMLSICATNFIKSSQIVKQISFFEKENEGDKKQEKIENTIIRIKEKLGNDTITTAAFLNNDLVKTTHIKNNR